MPEPASKSRINEQRLPQGDSWWPPARREARRGVFIIATVLTLALHGCKGDKPGGGAAPQSGNVKAAAGEIGTRATSIDKHTGAIDKIAGPPVRAETDGIRGDTSALRELQGRLDAAQATIASTERLCGELNGKVVDLGKEKAALQVSLDKAKAQKNTLLSWFLASIAALAVLGIPLSIFLARSIPLALLCVSVFGCAVAGQLVLEYRVQVAIGVGVLLVLGALYLFFVQHKSVGEFFALARKVGPLTDGAAVAAAEESLSARAKKIAAALEKNLPTAGRVAT